MTQPEDRATDTKEAQMERYEKALLTLTQLTTEVTTRMGLTDESDNYNLENFEYQSGILQLIIELAQEAKDTLLNLINMRKRLYSIQGCLAVDPQKLLFGPYQQLCFAYEDLERDQDALFVCEKAINHCKLICQSDSSGQETEAQKNLLLRKKHFLEKAKTLAFKCGDDNQMRMQNSDFTA